MGRLQVLNMAGLNYSNASKSMFGPQGHNSHVYISQDHEKVNFGRIGPGPAHYNSHDGWRANGHHPDSTKCSAANTRLGKSERFYSVKDPKLPHGTPGPGQYCV